MQFRVSCLILLLFSSPVISQNAGFALRFDGQDDSVQIPDSSELSGGSGKSITVEAWVKLDNLKKDRPVIQKWLDTQWKEWSLTVDGSDQNEVSVAVETNGTNFEYKAGGGVIQAGIWHHLAMSFDWSTKMLRIFIDGVEYGSGGQVSLGMPDTRAKVLIGRHAYTANKHFLGQMDEVRIWGHARTAAQLQNFMNQPLSGDEPGLLAYWNLDETSGVQILDRSAGGHDGVFEQSELDGPQRIVSTAPFEGGAFVAVESPNGGEALLPGTSHTIFWTAVGLGPQVTIEFSDDAGAAWQTVKSATDNDGKFGWTVPEQPTDFGVIRVSDLDDPSLSDDSNEPFVISFVPEGDLSFTDITLDAGTGGPEGRTDTGGHAAIWADVNQDGYPDLYHTMLFTKGMPDLFFLNQGNNTFVNEGAARGIDDFDKGSHGSVWADLDNDGDFDLWNGTTFGETGEPAVNNLYHNDGNGFFSDVTSQAGISDRDWPTRGVTAFDMDNDGDLDLVGITNFQGSDDPAGEKNEVYRNDGNMRFTSIDEGDLYKATAGQGVTAADYDNDGDMDLFAGNRTGQLNVLRNDGAGNFDRISPESIGIRHRGREGVTFGDVNNDGWLDVLLSDFNEVDDFAFERLYMNQGDGVFAFSRQFKRTHGYMGAFGDLDNDGDLDIVFAGDSECYLNDGSGGFADGPVVPTDKINDPRAIAFADIDRDGDLDFAIGAKRSRNWLIRNDFDAGNWLQISLVSPQGQAGAFGAKIRLYRAGDLGGTLLGFREARGANGYLGQNEPVVHFGLGPHISVDIEVEFLDGSKLSRTLIDANQRIMIDPFYEPHVNGFSPSAGLVGREVRIAGKHFLNATGVAFAGVSAEFTIDSDREITALVPEDAPTGLITVSNANGTSASTTSFVVIGSLAPLTFLPSDDGQVKQSEPDRNYGDKSSFKVELDNFFSYLKFDISGLDGTVDRALLRMLVVNGSSHAGEIYLVANDHPGDGPWSESTLTFATAPAIQGAALDDRGAVQTADTVEFDVTSAFTGADVVSFALQSRVGDLVEYSSKEGEYSPQLVISRVPAGPEILAFAPTGGPPGSEVGISGNNFAFVDGVAFGAVATQNFVVESDSLLRAQVPEGALTAPLVVFSPLGSDTSATEFMVQAPPEILALSPAAGFVGTEVSILGKHLASVDRVAFGEIEVGLVEHSADTLLLMVVPQGAVTAPVVISGAFGTDTSQVSFQVLEGREVTFSPVADAYVVSSEPERYLGRENELQVSRSRISRAASFMKFDLADLVGEIRQVSLRLHVLNGSDDGGAIYLAENTYPDSPKPWREVSLSWASAPKLRSLPLAVLGPVPSGGTVEFDLTDVVVGAGVYSFALQNNSPDKVLFSAREGERAPVLIIVTEAEPGAGPMVDASQDGIPPQPADFHLFPNFPNPFNAETVLQYALPMDSEVEVLVFNLRGQVVRTLVRARQDTGVRRVVWDGRNQAGQELASGVYFIRMTAAGRIFVRRIAFQK